MLPNFIVLGAQKSASTFVQACLAEHPEIYMPAPEIPFFESPDYEESTISDLEKLLENRPEKILGIKRPNYLGKPEVPERIHHHIPDAKFVVILRNPIERAVSAYYHNVNYGFIPPKDLEEGMEIILNHGYQNTYNRAQEIINFGLYYQHLKRYYQFFEAHQFLVLLHEQVIREKQDQIQKIYHFLGADSSYLPQALSSRPQAVTYSIPRLRFLSLRNSLIYRYNSDRTRLFPKKRNWLGKMGATVVTGVDRVFCAPLLPSQKPQLSDRLRQKLYCLYQDEIQNLEKLTGFDLSHWKNN